VAVGVRVVEAGTWQRLEALPDPRSPQGRTCPLACLAAIATCAFTAAGNDRFTAVGQWDQAGLPGRPGPAARPVDPIAGWYRAPDEKTIRVVLDRVDPRALARALLRPGRRPSFDDTPPATVLSFKGPRRSGPCHRAETTVTGQARPSSRAVTRCHDMPCFCKLRVAPPLSGRLGPWISYGRDWSSAAGSGSSGRSGAEGRAAFGARWTKRPAAMLP
jgi:DDE family transposase